MKNNARNPIPEELHVYSHDEGTGNGTTPAGVEWLDGWISFCYEDVRAIAPDKNRSTVAIPYLKIPNRYLITAKGYLIIASLYLIIAEGYLNFPDGYLIIASLYLIIAEGYLIIARGYLNFPDRYLIMAGGYSISSIQ